MHLEFLRNQNHLVPDESVPIETSWYLEDEPRATEGAFPRETNAQGPPTDE